MNWNRWSREVSEAKAERQRLAEERMEIIMEDPTRSAEEIAHIALGHVEI